jgi:hypothetical protein
MSPESSCSQLLLRISPYLKDISSSSSGQQLIEFPPAQAVVETCEEPARTGEEHPELPFC